MVLIFSKNNEFSTDEVLDWLSYYNIDFIRINGSDIFENSNFSVNLTDIHESFIINNSMILTDDIDSIWYRRWSSKDGFSYYNFEDDHNIFAKINTNINREYFGASDAVFSMFKNKKWLNHPSQNLKKIDVLRLAKQINLIVPDTIITNSKSVLKSFLAKHEGIITKPITDFNTLTCENNFTILYTSEIYESDIDQLSEYFFPTLFQNKIVKEYEIRTFYLNDSFFSMAIFSQGNTKTEIDFRQYDSDTPNRTVPYQLPKSIEQKLRKLLKKLSLNCGSIDIIKDTRGNYIFLEINPVGQFGMTSYPCNYYLEKKIAEYLYQ